MTFRRIAACGSVLLLIPLCCSIALSENYPTATAEMEQIRQRHHLPSLAAIVMIDGKVRFLDAVGVRKLGSARKVLPNDQWQIGSCTKSMNATLAAMLVEQGKLCWNTTIADIFPEWRDEIEPAWRPVTLTQLLQHRGGAPKDSPPDLWELAWEKIGTPTEQRSAFVHGLLTRQPEAPPGTRYIYSNQGYAIAGAMLERVAKKSWEELMQELLFVPLNMRSVGFGAPGTPGKIDQPWGHGEDKNKPVPPGPNADNPPAIAPAAAVHCSLTDLAHYADLHIRGHFADTPMLKNESFLKLHTAHEGPEHYAMGWVVEPRPWAGGITLAHNGSNTAFFVDLWVAPEKKAVLISATNTAKEGEKATDEMIGVLIRDFLNENRRSSGQFRK